MDQSGHGSRLHVNQQVSLPSTPPRHCAWTYTSDYQVVILTVKRATGTFSLAGCVFMLFVIWLLRRYHSLAQKMILSLTVAAFFDSLAYVMGESHPEGSLCDFQAWWLTYFDVVLMASSDRDLQLSLDRFAAECEATGMRISTSKSDSMVLARKRVECHLRVGEETLPQVEEFKYLGVLFTSEGRVDREIDRRIGAASSVMRTLYRSVVVKKELSRKAKLSIYRSIYVPILTYGHELWVMTERIRSRVQAAEISFLRRVAGLSLRDRVRSSAIRGELKVKPLLLHIKRSQMRWFGHLVRMPPVRLPSEVFRARPTGRRPRGRPRTRWEDYVSRLAWERLGIPREELDKVAGEREVWVSLLRLLPP
ncbi:si:dkey-100n23.5 isoform X4 [Nerophis ophidion]|uniref:si:dkey-100n23.5 isoform X4 n=1 Tax=Nerophis ophidion TaxID=159077 RepID=UPI002ADFF5A0|nr:si:dkey-100n23.5 isoform X4 [Nerophis ophidion]